MQTLSKPDVYTSFEGVSQLRSDAKTRSPQAIKKVAQQFESLFVQMMLKSMRDTLPQDGLFNSSQQRIYQDMFDKQISMNMSSARGIGLAAVIERQLGGGVEQQVRGEKQLGDYFDRAVMSYQPVARAFAIDHPYSDSANLANPRQMVWEDAETYLQDIWPHAVNAANQLGVAPEVLMAQSALETGWGKYVPQFANGENSFNLFGIKADRRWQGKIISQSTLEFKQGTMQREQAHFRAYESLAEAFNDYVDFIQGNPRYQRALEKSYNPSAYARELQQAGYATDPDYAHKIDRVRNSELMRAQVAELKNS